MDFLVYNDGLSIAMAMMSTVLLALVMLVFLTGLLKKKETMKDTILMCNMMFAFLAYAVFQMVAVVLQTLVGKDMALTQKASMWCKFVGAIGVFAITNPLGATLIFSFHLLYDQIQSETSKRNKHTFIKASIFVQYILLLIIAIIPCLPIASFQAALPCNEQTLCLPLTSPGTELKGWNSFLLAAEVLTAIVAIAVLVFVSYRMHRQQSLLSSMIPMEARVLRKKATKVKRIGLLLLTLMAFRLPGVGALLGLALYPVVTIEHTTIQWVFGFIVPMGEVVACALYLFMIGCKKSLQKRYFKYRPTDYDAKVESLSGNQQVSPNLYSSTDEKGAVVNYEKSPHAKKTVNFFNGTVPTEVSWIRDAVIPDRFKGRYGIIEWQTQNGSPRRGLLKVFPPSQYKCWTWESSTLAKLNRLGHHDNIVSFLWATTSTSCRITDHQGDGMVTDDLKLERYLCTAYYPHGTLREVLHTYPKKFRENLAHNLLLQVSKGILYLHDNNMSHQDLNTKNIHVGGKIETMNLRIVISNFSKAIDLSKHNQRKKEEYSDFTIYQEIDPPKDNSVKKPTTESMQLVVEEVQRLYANDIRAFGLIMLEILETVRLHFLPKDMCVHFSEGQKNSLVPEITLPRLPSAEYDFAPNPGPTKQHSDEVMGDYNRQVFSDSLPTEAELSLTRGTPKRNSAGSSDSGISSNRTSMRSKGSSVGSSFGKKGDTLYKEPPKQKISKLSQIKRRALARNGGKAAAATPEVETDTTEVADSSNSSAEELDGVGYLPNFPKDSSGVNGPYSPPPIDPSQLARKGSSPAALSSATVGGVPGLEDNSEPPSSALPRSSNSFSKFYVIRSRGLDGTSSPRISSRRRSSPIQESIISESESETRSTPDEIPLSVLGSGFYDSTANYNSSLPRGSSRVLSEDKLMQAYQLSHDRRSSDFSVPNITPAIDYGQHSLPRKPKKLLEDNCPSNLTNRHMLQCQDMLSTMDSLRAVTLMNRIHVKEDCHKMVMRWLATQKTDTCLYKQMIQILKSAWTREPPYIAGLIYRKLDNCLTEVDL